MSSSMPSCAFTLWMLIHSCSAKQHRSIPHYPSFYKSTIQLLHYHSPHVKFQQKTLYIIHCLSHKIQCLISIAFAFCQNLNMMPQGILKIIPTSESATSCCKFSFSHFATDISELYLYLHHFKRE